MVPGAARRTGISFRVGLDCLELNRMGRPECQASVRGLIAQSCDAALELLTASLDFHQQR